jgi:hypothetical protein
LFPDFRDLLTELARAGAEFVIVGGYAVSAWGHLRTTKDIDGLIRATPDNARRVYAALARFGAPLHDLTVDDLAAPGTFFQIGLPPRRVDIISSLPAITWEEASTGTRKLEFDGVAMPVIGLEALLKNKRAVGRPEDKKDVRELERIHGITPPRPARRAGPRKKVGETRPRKRRPSTRARR